MSTLFSVLLIFNKFTNDKETLMFQLSGASIFQIIKPIFLVCILNFLIARFFSTKLNYFHNLDINLMICSVKDTPHHSRRSALFSMMISLNAN